jgi:small subunit ribosomal protein S25
MVRKAKFIPTGPSKLSQLIASLNAPPKLALSNLKSLKLTLAFQNDHFGARCASTSLGDNASDIILGSHFVKEQLPRIRYANPTLDIQVEKVRKTAQEAWRPEIELHFSASHPTFSLPVTHSPSTAANGSHKTLDMHEKWSTSILKELREAAGGDLWRQWKVESAATGLPLVPGEENEHRIVKRLPVPPPSLKVFRASRPPPLAPEPQSQQTSKGKEAEEVVLGSKETNQVEVPIPPPVPKTGVAAALP